MAVALSSRGRRPDTTPAMRLTAQAHGSALHIREEAKIDARGDVVRDGLGSRQDRATAYAKLDD